MNRDPARGSRFSLIDSRIMCNADMRVAETWQYCRLDKAGEMLARTIADLAGYENIRAAHLAKALQSDAKSDDWIASSYTTPAKENMKRRLRHSLRSTPRLQFCIF